MSKNVKKFVTGKTEKEANKKMDRPNIEGLKVSGGLKFTGRDKDGRILWVKKEKNLITDDGFDFISDVIGLTAQPTEITHMAVGNSTASTGDASVLTSETQRKETIYAHSTGTKTFTFTTTFSTGVTAITEYGCFNASSGGTMLNTAGFSAITVDSLEIVATFTLSS